MPNRPAGQSIHEGPTKFDFDWYVPDMHILQDVPFQYCPTAHEVQAADEVLPGADVKPTGHSAHAVGSVMLSLFAPGRA